MNLFFPSYRNWAVAFINNFLEQNDEMKRSVFLLEKKRISWFEFIKYLFCLSLSFLILMFTCSTVNCLSDNKKSDDILKSVCYPIEVDNMIFDSKTNSWHIYAINHCWRRWHTCTPVVISNCLWLKIFLCRMMIKLPILLSCTFLSFFFFFLIYSFLSLSRSLSYFLMDS